MTDQPAQTNGDWTIGRLLSWTRDHFQSRGLDEPRLCAELLLAKALECPKIALYTRFNESPTSEQRATYRELVKAAAAHKPIAYLVGHREFYSLDFIVTPDVLIPRPETELLVEHALKWCKANPQETYTLLDLATGSGCIAVTIAKRLPAVRVVATDISEKALAVAAQNAQKHGVADRIRFVAADLLKLPAETCPSTGFDIIVSNPPYIAEHNRDALPANVRDFEPSIALYGGTDGLALYRRIAAEILNHLRPGGTFLVEVGEGQADAVEKIFLDAGLQTVARHKDLAAISRALQFTRPA